MMNAVGFSVMRELKNIGNLQRVKVNSDSNLLLEGGKFWESAIDFCCTLPCLELYSYKYCFLM